MSINKNAIVLALRKRMVTATGITPATQLQTENTEIKTEGLSLWIRESVIYGTERAVTPFRSRMSGFMVQYDIFTPSRKGSAAGDAAENNILKEFDLANMAKDISVDGMDVSIRNISVSSDESKDWHRNVVLLNMDVISRTHS